MNIYELEKRATPGEIAVEKIGTAPKVFFTLEDTLGYEIADICGDKAEYDARLLAHCRNNYIKALEALKSRNDDCDCGHCHWCVQIKELEEVK